MTQAVSRRGSTGVVTPRASVSHARPTTPEAPPVARSGRREVVQVPRPRPEHRVERRPARPPKRGRVEAPMPAQRHSERHREAGPGFLARSNPARDARPPRALPQSPPLRLAAPATAHRVHRPERPARSVHDGAEHGPLVAHRFGTGHHHRHPRVRRVSRRVQRERLPVRVAPSHHQHVARTARTYPVALDADAALRAVTAPRACPGSTASTPSRATSRYTETTKSLLHSPARSRPITPVLMGPPSSQSGRRFVGKTTRRPHPKHRRTAEPRSAWASILLLGRLQRERQPGVNGTAT